MERNKRERMLKELYEDFPLSPILHIAMVTIFYAREMNPDPSWANLPEPVDFLKSCSKRQLKLVRAIAKEIAVNGKLIDRETREKMRERYGD